MCNNKVYKLHDHLPSSCIKHKDLELRQIIKRDPGYIEYLMNTHGYKIAKNAKKALSFAVQARILICQVKEDPELYDLSNNPMGIRRKKQGCDYLYLIGECEAIKIYNQDRAYVTMISSCAINLEAYKYLLNVVSFDIEEFNKHNI